MRARSFIHYLLVTFFLFTNQLLIVFAQDSDSLRFEKDYQGLLHLIRASKDSIEHAINLVDKNHHLTSIQKARLNLLNAATHNLNVTNSEYKEIYNSDIDSISNDLSELDNAINFIKQSRTITGIPLLQKYLETNGKPEDSSDYANIYLAEGYRKIMEYQKGMDVIYDLLKKDLSQENKAFAYNRLAALYAECGTWMVEHRYDSVLKYSNLCIRISEEYGFPYHLATAQNELCFYYYINNDYERGLNFGRKAYENFKNNGYIPDAINVQINLAKIYYKLDQNQKANEILLDALKLEDAHKVKNLAIKIYLLLAQTYYNTGDITSAYEYLNIGRKMQIEAYHNKIRVNIYDLSTKYETEKKEKENLQLRMDNEIKAFKLSSKNKAINLLVIGILIISASLFLIFFLYSQKKKAYSTLVNRNLELAEVEKEYGFNTGTFKSFSPSNRIHSDQYNRALSDSDNLGKRLQDYMINEKPYLASDISLDDFSHHLNTNRTYISKFINEHYNKNFNDFINEYRIKTARLLLADQGKSHISIEGIGQMSGFNSRTTFFTSFKKYTGISPSYFRQSII